MSSSHRQGTAARSSDLEAKREADRRRPASTTRTRNLFSQLDRAIVKGLMQQFSFALFLTRTWMVGPTRIDGQWVISMQSCDSLSENQIERTLSKPRREVNCAISLTLLGASEGVYWAYIAFLVLYFRNKEYRFARTIPATLGLLVLAILSGLDPVASILFVLPWAMSACMAIGAIWHLLSNNHSA